MKIKSSKGRKVIYLIILFIGIFVGYFVYDMSEARQLAAGACLRATPGMPLEDFLSKISGDDYKIIRRDQSLMVVPKRGLGRNHCTVSHNGQEITGSKAGFAD